MLSMNAFRQLQGALTASMGGARLMIAVPIYVMLATIAIPPIVMLIFLIFPFHPRLSIFDSFIGDFMSTPLGVMQRLNNIFYLYLYLISYLSIASVVGYEERRDRSIIFWKSLPISDLNWVLGQILALICSFFVGFVALFFINTVVTFWESIYFFGLNHSDSSIFSNYARMLNDMYVFGVSSVTILYLSLPIGTSMIWFATFTKRQPGVIWLGVFLTIYLVAFLFRYVGLDYAWPLLWYPENFGKIATSLITVRQVPSNLPFYEMCAVVPFLTVLFAFLAWRSRLRAMPVS